jgi:Uma2 family endonuclease
LFAASSSPVASILALTRQGDILSLRERKAGMSLYPLRSTALHSCRIPGYASSMNEISPVSRQRATTQAAEGLPRLAWTVEEFDSLAEHGFFTEDDRIELIGGELVPMSPKGNRHEVVRGDLALWLSRNVTSDIKVYVEPGWRADATNYLEPDILIFPDSHSLGELPASEVLLVVEVAHSSLAYDTGRKAKIYARLGVREYWVVNAKSLETIVHLEPSAEGYGKIATHAASETVAPLALPALTVSLGALKIG